MTRASKTTLRIGALRALLAGALFFQSLGSAQAYSCDKGEGRRSFDTGFAQGRELLRGAWARLAKDCSRQRELRALLSRLHDSVTPKGKPSVAIQCRIDGNKVGMHSVLKEIRRHCSEGEKD